MIIHFVIRTLFHMRPSSDAFFFNTLQEHPPFSIPPPQRSTLANFDTRWYFPFVCSTFLCTHILTIFRFSARLELKYCCTWKIQILVWCSRSERNKTPLPYRESFFPPPSYNMYTIHIYIIHVCPLVRICTLNPLYTKQSVFLFSFSVFYKRCRKLQFPSCRFIYRIRLWDNLLVPFKI